LLSSVSDREVDELAGGLVVGEVAADPDCFADDAVRLSIWLVVYTARLSAGGKAKYGMTRSQASRQDWLICG
jgi:hypothetical protein